VNPRRVWIVGNSGSGKSTLAAAAARRLGVPHVELDSLQHGPGWLQATPDELRGRAEAALAGDAWVCDGNYRIARDEHMHRAQLVVWIDYPLPIVVSRVTRRTAVRLVTRRRIYNGNRERWRNLVDPSHPMWWAWTSHAPRRREYEATMDARWLRLRSPREAAGWLRGLRAEAQASR
jgi:adenylate kinase family enzyme